MKRFHFSIARRGSLVAELAVAMAILSAAIALGLQSAAVYARQQRLLEQHQWAMQEAANLMEPLAASSWDALAPTENQPLELSPQCQTILPGARAVVSIVAEKEPVAGRRITVRLDWREASDHRSEPVRLTAWKYKPREEEVQ